MTALRLDPILKSPAIGPDMRDRVNLLLIALYLIGTGSIFGELVARWAAWPRTADVLGTIALPAVWAYAVGLLVQRAYRREADRAAAPVSEGWLPDALGIEFSLDLLPDFIRSQQEISDACRAFRSQQGIPSPCIRIRDDALLAARTYAISIHGIRISGATLGPSDDFPTQLLSALKSLWTTHADAIRYFADQRAHSA